MTNHSIHLILITRPHAQHCHCSSGHLRSTRIPYATHHQAGRSRSVLQRFQSVQALYAQHDLRLPRGQPQTQQFRLRPRGLLVANDGRMGALGGRLAFGQPQIGADNQCQLKRFGQVDSNFHPLQQLRHFVGR